MSGENENNNQGGGGGDPFGFSSNLANENKLDNAGENPVEFSGDLADEKKLGITDESSASSEQSIEMSNVIKPEERTRDKLIVIGGDLGIDLEEIDDGVEMVDMTDEEFVAFDQERTERTIESYKAENRYLITAIATIRNEINYGGYGLIAKKKLTREVEELMQEQGRVSQRIEEEMAKKERRAGMNADEIGAEYQAMYEEELKVAEEQKMNYIEGTTRFIGSLQKSYQRSKNRSTRETLRERIDKESRDLKMVISTPAAKTMLGFWRDWNPQTRRMQKEKDLPEQDEDEDEYDIEEILKNIIILK